MVGGHELGCGQLGGQLLLAPNTLDSSDQLILNGDLQ